MTELTTINPTDLLTDLNVRAELRLDKGFIASIKDHGVLQPVVAVQTPDGLRVRMGHRRVAAAVEAGLTNIPVLVVGDETTDDTGTIDRLLTQHAENHHRAALTTAEDAQVARQLSLLGLSATQIAKRTHTKKTTVDAQLAVAASELATKATDRYDLTLDQAVIVAEFEDDTATVKALIAAATTGQFDHVAQRARATKAETEAKAPLVDALTEAGTTIVDHAPRYSEPAERLDALCDIDKNEINPTEHETCPGHAVFLTDRDIYTEPDGTVLGIDRWGDVEWPEAKTPADEDEAQARFDACTITTEWYPEPICADPAQHGHYTTSQWYTMQNKPVPAAEKSDAERDVDRQERRLVIDNNKAWKDAREVRNRWITQFLARKTLPADAGQFMARAVVDHTHLLGDTRANKIAAEWFGCKETAGYGNSAELAKHPAAANDKRAHVIALGALLAGYEKAAGDGAWRTNGDTSSTGHYLRYLATNGYTLSDVETYAASNKTV